MQLDTNLLLTAEKHRLDDGLIRGEKVNGTFAIKRVASQTYLVVSELQARVLDEFAQPKNVPEVLETCIRKRSCPALRDFYDLILKAHVAGVLRSEELGADGPAPAARPPANWILSLPPGIALVVASISFVATAAMFVLKAPVLPGTKIDWLIGWAAACGAFSLGQILAASVLRNAGGEVHRPHLRWLSPLPHFALDLRDTCLLGRKSRAAVHAIQLAPLALTAGAGLRLGATWSFVPLVALLVACRSFGGSPVQKLLFLLRRRPLLDTDEAPLFNAQPNLDERCRAAWRRFDGRVAAARAVANVAWIAALGFLVYRCLNLEPPKNIFESTAWRPYLPGIGAVLAGCVLLWLANAIQYDVVDAVTATSRRWSVRWRRWLSGKAPLAASADVELVIRRNPLLRRLSPELQFELAQHAQPFTAKAWRRLLSFDEDPPVVGLILSGTATLYRRRKSGGRARFLRVMEGDLFGAHKLVDAEFSNLEIRTNTPLHALVFDSAVFKRLVVDTLGPKVVRDYVHKHLFLQRASPMCAEWRPTAVARFAELAATTAHAAGGKIIARGQEVSNLYVLYEGRARALHGKKAVGSIDPGDFFGELSLLQSSAASADVESKEDGRCLVVNRVDFIRFMSRNHHVALQMERLCSKRLGRPIFPLDERAF